MAPSELAEIRALLVAQMELMEVRQPPRLLGIVGSLLKPRANPNLPPPLPLPARPSTGAWRGVLDTPFGGHDEDALLLLGEEIDPDVFEPFDIPPPPRGEFGVRPPRPYLPHDSVLLLNKRAPAEARRLTLLTDAGEAVGEIYLKPDERIVRRIDNSAHVVTEHEAPYFPGDLEEEAEAGARRPLPAPIAPTSVKVSRIERRGAARRSLGADLLQALALTLAREHETLCDRLMDVSARA